MHACGCHFAAEQGHISHLRHCTSAFGNAYLFNESGVTPTISYVFMHEYAYCARAKCAGEFPAKFPSQEFAELSFPPGARLLPEGVYMCACAGVVIMRHADASLRSHASRCSDHPVVGYYYYNRDSIPWRTVCSRHGGGVVSGNYMWAGDPVLQTVYRSRALRIAGATESPRDPHEITVTLVDRRDGSRTFRNAVGLRSGLGAFVLGCVHAHMGCRGTERG